MIGKLIINEEQQEVRKYLERGKQDNVLGQAESNAYIGRERRPVENRIYTKIKRMHESFLN